MSALQKILVVDDDPVVGQSFDRVLSSKGYAVITAHDAHEALERLRREDVDLVYTDIKMPGMDGLELAENLRTDRPWTPVVIVTGYGSTADEGRARSAGVSAFLHKPLSPEVIEDSAAQALRHVPAANAPVAPAPAPTAEPSDDTVAATSRLKNVTLFLAAPFIGLAYALMLPFIGLGALLWMGLRAAAGTVAVRRIGTGLAMAAKLLVAPLVGLAYVVVLPFAGLAALAWIGGRALLETRRHG